MAYNCSVVFLDGREVPQPTPLVREHRSSLEPGVPAPPVAPPPPERDVTSIEVWNVAAESPTRSALLVLGIDPPITASI